MSTHITNPHKGGNKNRGTRKSDNFRYQGASINSGNRIRHNPDNYPNTNPPNIGQQDVQFATPHIVNHHFSAPDQNLQTQLQHGHQNVTGQIDQQSNILNPAVQPPMTYFNGHHPQMGYVPQSATMPVPMFHPNPIPFNPPAQVAQNYPSTMDGYRTPATVSYTPMPAPVPVPVQTEFELVEPKKQTVPVKRERKILSFCDPVTKKSVFEDESSNIIKDTSSKESTPFDSIQKSASSSSVKTQLVPESIPVVIRSRQNSERISESGGTIGEGSSRIKEEFKRRIAERAVGTSVDTTINVDRTQKEDSINTKSDTNIENHSTQEDEVAKNNNKEFNDELKEDIHSTETIEEVEVKSSTDDKNESSNNDNREGLNTSSSSGTLTKSFSKDQVTKKLSFASEQPKHEEKPNKETYYELLTEFESVMEDPKFDREKCFYPRNFIKTYRIAVQLFNVAPNPVSNEIKALLYYDRNAISSSVKGKRNEHQFQPPWGKTPGDQNRKSYGGRNSHGHSNDRRKNRNNAVARPSIERSRQTVQLHKAENAWKPAANNDDINSKLLKEVRGILNKITPTNFDPLVAEFLKLRLFEKKEILQNVIDLIFAKAVEEPRFCSIYSDLFSAQVSEEKKKSTEQKSSFAVALIQKSQSTFEKKNCPFTKEIEQIREELKTETDEKVQKEKNERINELMEKEKRYTFGTIRFIAHLYRHSLLVAKIVSYCATFLITMYHSEHNEKALEQAVLLFESVGKHWSQDNVKYEHSINASLTQIKKCLPTTEGSFNESLHPKLSKRMQFMLENLIETSENDWIPRNARMHDGPKKIDEVHEEIKNEEMRNAILRDQYARGKDNESNRRRPYTGANSVDRRYNSSKNINMNRRNTDLRDNDHNVLKTQAKSFADGCNPKDTRTVSDRTATIPRTRKGENKKDSNTSKRQPSPTVIGRSGGSNKRGGKPTEDLSDDFYNETLPNEPKYDKESLESWLKEVFKDPFNKEKIIEVSEKIEKIASPENGKDIAATILSYVFLDGSKISYFNSRGAIGRIIGKLLGSSKSNEILSGFHSVCEGFEDEYFFTSDCPRAWIYFGELLANGMVFNFTMDGSSEKLTLEKLDEVFAAAESKKSKEEFLSSFLKCAIAEENLIEPIEDDEKRNSFVKSLINSLNKLTARDDGLISENMKEVLRTVESKRDDKNLLEVIRVDNSNLATEFLGYQTLPMLSSQGSNSLFQFGKVRKIEDFHNPYFNIDPKVMKSNNEEKQISSLPKGVYSYIDTERNFNSNFKLPDINNPIDISGSMKSKNNYINGLYLPMPFGFEPVNVQVFRENEQENAIEGTVLSVNEVRKAKEQAKIVCKQGATAECNRLLEKYYTLKSETMHEEDSSLFEKLVKLTDSVGNTGYRNEKKKGLGVLFGLPGMGEPIYWKARFDNIDNNNINLNANIPRYNNFS
uniref:MIF4G domain-containing protein n=1 Tax=Parastrongyloides trichosuri TaxID=131310 RepID=A0A0N4ZEZ9_PARTI